MNKMCLIERSLMKWVRLNLNDSNEYRTNLVLVGIGNFFFYVIAFVVYNILNVFVKKIKKCDWKDGRKSSEVLEKKYFALLHKRKRPNSLP